MRGIIRPSKGWVMEELELLQAIQESETESNGGFTELQLDWFARNSGLTLKEVRELFRKIESPKRD